jgi:hypothetical protein
MNNRDDVLNRLGGVSAESQGLWGSMSAHQMICHLSDAFRIALDEKPAAVPGRPLRRTIRKWFALWVPVPWPHNLKTNWELDKRQGGTRPAEFASDLDTLCTLWPVGRLGEEVAPNAMFGQMSKTERMRFAYLHMDHHLRQFGV